MTINYKEKFAKFKVLDEERSFFLTFDLDINTDIEPLFMLLDYLKAREVMGNVAFFETKLDEFDIIEYLHEFYPPFLPDGSRDTRNTILLIRELKNGLITGVPSTFPAWYKRFSKVYDEAEIKNWEYRKSS